MTTQGKRLRNIRQALCLTQEQLGTRLGISKQFYSNIETDKTLLNNDKLVLLLQYYNVNMNYLLGGKGVMFNPTTEKKEDKDNFAQRVRVILREEGLIC